MRKDRLDRSWSLDELSRQSGIHPTYLSRIETGKRPPNEKIAAGADRAFETTWYSTWYQDARDWMPAGFRDWPELEVKATRLSVWSPGVVDGLVMVEEYARAILATLPGVTADAVETRAKRRMERQRHLLRPDGPVVHVIIDQLALVRRVSCREVMAEQCAHLVEVSQLPTVTLQVHPPIEHPATASGFVIANDAVFVEHVLGGGVYADEPAVASVTGLFEALRKECYGAQESLLIVRKARNLWTGVSLPSRVPRERPASKQPPEKV